MDKFEESMLGFKTNPEKYKTNEFYITPDGSKIEVVFKDDFTILGHIVESKMKSQIGHLNIFLWSELITQEEITKLNLKICPRCGYRNTQEYIKYFNYCEKCGLNIE